LLALKGEREKRAFTLKIKKKKTPEWKKPENRAFTNHGRERKKEGKSTIC
jgi:hypothetical protein